MPRRKRPLQRDTGVVRDASLVVIASEDMYAVNQYFDRFRTRRVQFLVLPTADSRSSPIDVQERLDKFKAEYATEPGDQFWLCIDTDHWSEPNHIKNLMQVVQHCRQKDYRLAISNPCFELWLLLHFQDFAPASAVTCEQVVTQLRQVAGGYNKKQVHRLSLDADKIRQALERARLMDKSADMIPQNPTTRVYLLIAELLRRDALIMA